MSDEYHDSGAGDSLVNQSIEGGVKNTDFETKNYPAEGDSTSSGGYGGDAFTRDAQRGLVDSSQPEGVDARGEDSGFAQATSSDATIQKPSQTYDQSLDSREDAEQRLASAYTDARATNS